MDGKEGDMAVNDEIWAQMIATGELAGRRVHYFTEIGSTNEAALQLGRQGEPTGTLVVAESQSSGRGRLGRAWASPKGRGLYFSMLLRPEIGPEDLSKVTLVAALAVSKAVEEVTGLAPGIKWPNDLLLAGKKFCGILTETGPVRFGEPTLVVIGIGLNVSTSGDEFPSELRERATSLLLQSGREYAASELLDAIARSVAVEVERFVGGAFAEILNEWRSRDILVGKRMSWFTPNGKVVTGVALGPDEAGILHLRDDDGQEHEVVSGDLALAGSESGLS